MFPSTGWERTVPGCWLCSRCSLRTMGLTCHGFSCASPGPQGERQARGRRSQCATVTGRAPRCWSARHLCTEVYCRPAETRVCSVAGGLGFSSPSEAYLVLPLQAFLPWFLIGAGCLLPGPCWLHPGTGFCCQHVGQECLHLVSLSILRPPYFCSKYLLMSLYNQSPQS